MKADWNYYSAEPCTPPDPPEAQWTGGGTDPPDGLWRVVKQSPDELILFYSGDILGDLGGLSLWIDKQFGTSLVLQLEFLMAMSQSEMKALSELFSRGLSWSREPSAVEIGVLDFYRGQCENAGGVILLAKQPGSDGFLVVFWSRQEEYEVRYKLSVPAVEALFEMAACASAWNPDSPFLGE